MQTNIVIDEDGNATGTLKYIAEGLSPSGPLSGAGYFLALKWSNPATPRCTSLKVGLVPSSSGMEPVECLDDTDRNGVFKITPELNQKVVLIQSDGKIDTYQYVDLSGLEFEEVETI